MRLVWRIGWLVFFVALVLLPFSAFASQANQILKLVDYIGADYAGAVEQGQIINQFEYAEITQLHQIATDELEKLLANKEDENAQKLRTSLANLGKLVSQKKSSQVITEQATVLRQTLIDYFQISSSPLRKPSFAAGQELYQQHCAVCHGPVGVPSKMMLELYEPDPANFQDPEVFAALTPFKAFNVISLGIEGTAMQPIPGLGEEDRWNLAFYIFSLRYQSKVYNQVPQSDDNFSLAQLSDMGDLAIAEQLHTLHIEHTDLELGRLRRYTTYETSDDPLKISLTFLATAQKAIQEQNYDKAAQALISAYLDGVEQVEPGLRLADATLTQKIEQSFMQLRSSIKESASRQTLLSQLATLREDLVLANAKLSVSAENSWWTMLASLLIILREGVEAALIVGAILAIFRATGQERGSFSIHWGWILAVIAGIGTWIVSETLIAMSSANRELIEGISALLAAVVLFYVSYWLISKIDQKRWLQFIRSKVKRHLDTGNLIALGSVSFLAVYRESFETVLFYQALQQSSPNQEIHIAVGLLLGLLLLLGLITVMFYFGLRIPLQKFFLGSGAFLYLLAFVLAGQGIRALQESGLLPITMVAFPQLPILGIFASKEGLIVQGLFLVALVFGLWWFVRQKKLSARTP